MERSTFMVDRRGLPKAKPAPVELELDRSKAELRSAYYSHYRLKADADSGGSIATSL